MVTSKIEREKSYENKDRETLVKELRSFLKRQREVRFAYLFGSRASGYHRYDSDLDLGVFFEDGISSWTIVGLKENLLECIGIPIHIVPLGEELTSIIFDSIIEPGVVVKDGVGRKDWEEKVYRRVKEKRMPPKEYSRKRSLDSLEEKVRRIIKVLPLLDEIDLKKVSRDDPRAVRDFIGVFLMIFEPLETIAAKISNYANEVLDLGSESTTLRDRMKIMVGILDLSDETLEELGKLAQMRASIAHAYWQLGEGDISQLNIGKIKGTLEELISKLSLFIIEERGKLK